MPVGTGYSIGPLTVRSYSVSHDAADPVGYVFEAEGTRLTVATDLGVATPEALVQLADADAVVLESNHCPSMLQHGRYPAWLKRRIAGDHGHLSNSQAAEAALAIAHPGLRYVLLAHLSENNNTPRVAFETMTAALATAGFAPDLRVCRQHQIGNWIDLNEG
jgi:phosphoribosyl 1,2-cyclic phosphodiesterase